MFSRDAMLVSLKQWNGGHIGFPNFSSGNWALLSSKHFLFFSVEKQGYWSRQRWKHSIPWGSQHPETWFFSHFCCQYTFICAKFSEMFSSTCQQLKNPQLCIRGFFRACKALNIFLSLTQVCMLRFATALPKDSATNFLSIHCYYFKISYMQSVNEQS